MMRMMLYEAAQSMLVRSTKWSWLKAWAMKIARHRGMKKAIVGAYRVRFAVRAPCPAVYRPSLYRVPPSA
jgi:hypothetical protein